MGQRSIKFVDHAHHATRQRMTAVVWVTARHGGFVGTNVTADLAKALEADGYPVAQERVHAAMEWLEREGYAIRVVNGKRTVEFRIKPDVKVATPAYVEAQRAAAVNEQGARVMDAAERTQARRERLEEERQQRVAASPPPPPADQRPPLESVPVHRPRHPRQVAPPVPFRLTRRPEWLTDLDEVLTDWWKADPEASGAWAEEAIEAVRDGLA